VHCKKYHFLHIIKSKFRCFGAVGSILAPILIRNLHGVDYIVPTAVIALSQTVLFLPAILNKKLPATFDEASDLYKEGGSCCTY